MDTQTQVAYACNILSMEGHTDTIYGHVSARVENAEQIWMKPATLAQNMLPNGEVESPYKAWIVGLFLVSEIYQT